MASTSGGTGGDSDASTVRDGMRLPTPPEDSEWSLAADPVTGVQSLRLVKKAQQVQSEPTWDHFDGLNCAPSDFFIDLEGTRTDHAPDVRPYLAYIGQRMTAKASPQVSTLAELEEFFVQEGKRALVTAWKAGHGMFMKPRLELLALNTGLNQTMPWAGLARSHLAPSTRRFYDGDVGFEKGDDSPTMKSLEMVPGFMLFTNIRIPLPPKEYLKINPVDHPEEWQCMALANYQALTNPASRFNNLTEETARELQCGDALDGRQNAWTTPAWRAYLQSLVPND